MFRLYLNNVVKHQSIFLIWGLSPIFSRPKKAQYKVYKYGMV